MKNKKAIITDYLGWLILAVVALVIIIGGIVILMGKGEGAIEYIRRIFRIGP